MDNKRIFLTGFMGSGKTTVGRILADRLMLPFRDTDELIIERAGMSIPEIFDREGEQVFRKLEAQVVQSCSMEQGVFGLGGGAILDADNRDTLLDSGLVVYLRAIPETLAKRLQPEVAGRPLLSGHGDLGERIEDLLSQRAEIYEKAHWILDTDDLTPVEIAENLYRRMREETGD